MIGIYKFTNKYNRKVYIGKSTNIKSRYYTHLQNARLGKESHFYNAIRKYSIEGFDFDILIECPKEGLDYWEKFYIKYYCSNNPDYGYNMTDGGDGITNWSKELKEKASKSQSKRFENKSEREKASKAALNRFKQPEEHEKVRQEQYNRLKDEKYHDFLKEQFKIGSKIRWDRYNNLSEDEKQYYHDKHSNACKNGWANLSDERREEIRNNIKQAQLKYWSTHKGATLGKHKVWNDESHTSYHYE